MNVANRCELLLELVGFTAIALETRDTTLVRTVISLCLEAQGLGVNILFIVTSMRSRRTLGASRVPCFLFLSVSLSSREGTVLLAISSKCKPCLRKLRLLRRFFPVSHGY